MANSLPKPSVGQVIGRISMISLFGMKSASEELNLGQNIPLVGTWDH